MPCCLRFLGKSAQRGPEVYWSAEKERRNLRSRKWEKDWWIIALIGVSKWKKQTTGCSLARSSKFTRAWLGRQTRGNGTLWLWFRRDSRITLKKIKSRAGCESSGWTPWRGQGWLKSVSSLCQDTWAWKVTNYQTGLAGMTTVDGRCAGLIF